MTDLSTLVLADPQGSAYPLAQHRGTPLIIQALRYYG